MTTNRSGDPLSAKVCIRHGDEPAAMAREVLFEGVDPRYLRNRLVLVKPNVGFKFPPGAGVVTHPETVRGVIHFCKEAGAGETPQPGC